MGAGEEGRERLEIIGVFGEMSLEEVIVNADTVTVHTQEQGGS